MSEKKWFEVSGCLDCSFRFAVQAKDEAEAEELFWELMCETDADMNELIDWIDDIDVSNITPYEPQSQPEVITQRDGTASPGARQSESNAGEVDQTTNG
jgi:hypothetical protein